MNKIDQIIEFWFGAESSPDYGTYRPQWFKKSEAFDNAIRAAFLGDVEAAASGALDDWRDSPRGCLALILLLDQFPRNLFRNSPQAFAADPKARVVAEQALAQQFDQVLLPVQRSFLYLPFEHSEDLADQERSVALFTELGNENALDYAIRHRDIIVRFGRFPHRNAVLDRPSTAEEETFLGQPGSSF